MLDPREVVAVVTTPFFVKGPESLITVLEGLSRLPLSRVILLYDRKSPGVQHAKSAFARMKTELETQRKALILHEVDTYDTAPRWRLGIIEALKDDVVQVVFVFPGDTKGEPSAENRAGWSKMLAEAESKALVLGDYKSNDYFKGEFDVLTGLVAVRLLFPRLHQKLKHLGLSKIRTEFFIVGRDVYHHFETQSAFCWATDPTVQLILSILETDDLTVKRPVWLGPITDDPSHRRLLGQAHQIFRYVAQLVIDRMIHDMVEAGDDVEEHLKRYDDLRRILKRLFDKTLQALEENRLASVHRAESRTGKNPRAL